MRDWHVFLSYGFMAWWKTVAFVVTAAVVVVVNPANLGQGVALAAMAWVSTYGAANLACAAERRRIVRKARRCGYDV